jgi:hypothetical protein
MEFEQKKCMNEMYDGLWNFLEPRQLSIDGDKNMWILKPAGGARGVGISLSNQLIDLKFLPNSAYIVQKYIESPFLDNRLTQGKVVLAFFFLLVKEQFFLLLLNQPLTT